MTTRDTASTAALDSRLTSIGWGLFLVMAGGFLFVPSEQLPPGSWLIGIGAIMLGLNVVRLALGIRTSLVTSVLGIVALIAGFGDLAGVDMPVGPILLILIGAAIIFRNMDPRRA